VQAGLLPLPNTVAFRLCLLYKRRAQIDEMEARLSILTANLAAIRNGGRKDSDLAQGISQPTGAHAAHTELEDVRALQENHDKLAVELKALRQGYNRGLDKLETLEEDYVTAMADQIR